MKKNTLLAMLANLPENANIYIDSMDSTDANEILVETWASGDVDAYITDDAQAHIDYCDTLSCYGIKSLVIYRADGTNEKIK